MKHYWTIACGSRIFGAWGVTFAEACQVWGVDPLRCRVISVQ